MKKFILIGLMGAVGALFRYLISLLFQGVFPWGTLTVNILGCLLLPVIFILIRELGCFSTDLIYAIGTGFVGAFTTFSSFTVEIIRLIEDRNLSVALFYLLISISGGLLAAYCSVIFNNYVIRKVLKQKGI